MKSITLALLTLLLQWDLSAAPAFDDRFQFLYFAAIEGAHADGLTDSEVDRILMREDGKGAFLHFIHACPICMPVMNGLVAYRARPAFVGLKMPDHQQRHRTLGESLPEELRTQLGSERIEVRLKAINTLVTRWVDRRLKMLNLSASQRAVWEKSFEGGRQEGMKLLETFGKNGSLKVFAPGFENFKECAACNAATKRTFMGPQ